MAERHVSGAEAQRQELAQQAKPNVMMYVAIVTAMLGAIMFGIDGANFGAVQGFPGFLAEFCVGKFGDESTCGTISSTNNEAWMQGFVSSSNQLLNYGSAAGSVLLGPQLAWNLGRRWTVSVGCGISFLGCLLTSVLSFGNTPLFFFGRFATGFGVGMCSFALPIYSAEVSAPSVRGATGSLMQLLQVVGGVIASFVTYVDHTWQVGMLLPGILGAVVMVAVWLVPESPRFVMNASGYEAGLESLNRVRTGDAVPEAQEIFAQLGEEKSVKQVYWLDFVTQPNLRKRTFIAVYLQWAQQFTGINVMVFYSATLFGEMGFSDVFLVNLLFNLVMMMGCALGLVLIDTKWGGRRTQLLVSTALFGPMMALTAAATAWKWNQTFQLMLIMAMGFVWQVSWGLMGYLYPSEIFTNAERDRGNALAQFSMWMFSAVVAVVCAFMLSHWGAAATLLFFACYNALNLVWIWIFVRETKGVLLEDVPALFGSTSKDGQSSEQAGVKV